MHAYHRHTIQAFYIDCSSGIEYNWQLPFQTGDEYQSDNNIILYVGKTLDSYFSGPAYDNVWNINVFLTIIMYIVGIS